MLRLARYPIKHKDPASHRRPQAVRVACCFFSFVFCGYNNQNKSTPPRQALLLSPFGSLTVLAFGGIHTEVIRGISDILRFLCRFPAAVRRIGAAMTNEATCAPENPSEPSFSSLWRPVPTIPPPAVIATWPPRLAAAAPTADESAGGLKAGAGAAADMEEEAGGDRGPQGVDVAP